MEKETLANLVHAMLEANKRSRSEWAAYLGVTPQALSQWSSGANAPRPAPFLKLVAELAASSDEGAQRCMSKFDDISEVPLADVAPTLKSRGYRTLSEYVASAIADELHAIALRQLREVPPTRQLKLYEQVLQQLDPRSGSPEQARTRTAHDHAEIPHEVRAFMMKNAGETKGVAVDRALKKFGNIGARELGEYYNQLSPKPSRYVARSVSTSRGDE